MENLDQYATLLANLIENKKHHQLKIGELASRITEELGPTGLVLLSDRAREIAGRSYAVSTLRNFRWVYECARNLSLPEDLTFSALQVVAASKNPQEVANEIKEKGLSSFQIIATYAPRKKKKLVCKFCGKEN